MDNKFLSLWLKTWGLVKKLVGDVDVKEKGDLQTQIDNLKAQTDNIKIPTIPSIGNGTITIKQNGVRKGSFTTNQSGDTEIELTDNNTTYGDATTSAHGLMSAADKAKLNGIAEKANNYTYTHPSSHAAGMITQDSTHRFVSDAEKDTWNGKADGTHTHDNRYYTETEIDNLLKAQEAKIPSGLGSIQTGQWTATIKKGDPDLYKEFVKISSVFKRSAVIFVSLYVNGANSVDRYVSAQHDVSLLKIDHSLTYSDYTEFPSVMRNQLINYAHTDAQGVAIKGKQKWMLIERYPDNAPDGEIAITLHIPTPTGAKFTSGVIYLSWAVIM